jgi:hypothetical protein
MAKTVPDFPPMTRCSVSVRQFTVCGLTEQKSHAQPQTTSGVCEADHRHSYKWVGMVRRWLGNCRMDRSRALSEKAAKCMKRGRCKQRHRPGKCQNKVLWQKHCLKHNEDTAACASTEGDCNTGAQRKNGRHRNQSSHRLDTLASIRGLEGVWAGEILEISASGAVAAQRDWPEAGVGQGGTSSSAFGRGALSPRPPWIFQYGQFSPPSGRNIRETFLALLCEKRLEFLEVKAMKVGGLQWPWPEVSSQASPHTASSRR